MYTFKDKKVKVDIRIIVARHCNTILNDENKYQGIKYDFPLSETGLKQAMQLSSILKERNYKYDQIITSDTARAMETGELLTGTSSRFFDIDPRLNPFDLGDADAKREDELFTICRFPILARNKENLLSYFGRIREFLRELIANSNGKTVLLVTHEDISGLIDSYLQDYFLLKAPKNGVKNGEARSYHIWYEGSDADADFELKPDDIHFRGPNRWHCEVEEIGADEEDALNA